MLSALVETAVSELGLRGEPGHERLSRLRGLWERYRSVVNLTGSVLDEQVVESLLTCAVVREVGCAEQTWMDVGSGGGLPGLVLASFLSGRGLLVEPRERRAAFLWAALGAIGRGDCGVARARLQPSGWVGPDHRQCVLAEVVTARAVFSPAEWVQLSSRCVAAGGVVLVHERPGDPPIRGARLVGCRSYGGWRVSAVRL